MTAHLTADALRAALHYDTQTGVFFWLAPQLCAHALDAFACAT
jgi:hypothetical protein